MTQRLITVGYIVLGPVEGFWLGACDFFARPCDPWFHDPPYTIVVDSWRM